MSKLLDLSNIYFPESIYAAWMSVSFVLITLSLLFYHMARVKSIVMNTKYAGVYAVILILVSCFISFISILPYYTRFNNFYDKHKTKNLEKENIYHKLYIYCGIIVILIELIIAYTIIHIEFF
tara:strand:+ start:27 stop:395 length:369 start_codon:yes stop_codon:yes gene_type:complete